MALLQCLQEHRGHAVESRKDKATRHWNDAGLYFVRLVAEPSGRETQKIVVG
ncbi:hypothetical protein ACP6PL_28580 [Dapis sp. BLCC M126]|uniref:hypothetical protein n=1 Tax=Dapis sp. BLCC M126 TaxID=3400189 RepID=UPI003CF84D2D